MCVFVWIEGTGYLGHALPVAHRTVRVVLLALMFQALCCAMTGGAGGTSSSVSIPPTIAHKPYLTLSLLVHLQFACFVCRVGDMPKDRMTKHEACVELVEAIMHTGAQVCM